MITFELKVQFKRWGDIFAEAMLSDEQLYNQQVAPKLREQEMKIREDLDRSMQS